MALVECTLGPATTPIGSETYNFEKDRFGRCVAKVHNLKHLAILTGMPTYREVPETPTAPEGADGEPQQVEIADLEALVTSLTETVAERDATIATLTEANASLTAQLEASAAEVSRLTETLEDLTAPDQQQDPADGGASGDAGPQTTETPPPDTPPADDLRELSGLADASAAKLASKGITTFAQIAALTDDQMAAIDDELKLGGLSERAQWIAQAKAKVAELAKDQA